MPNTAEQTLIPLAWWEQLQRQMADLGQAYAKQETALHLLLAQWRTQADALARAESEQQRVQVLRHCAEMVEQCLAK